MAALEQGLKAVCTDPGSVDLGGGHSVTGVVVVRQHPHRAVLDPAGQLLEVGGVRALVTHVDLEPRRPARSAATRVEQVGQHGPAAQAGLPAVGDRQVRGGHPGSEQLHVVGGKSQVEVDRHPTAGHHRSLERVAVDVDDAGKDEGVADVDDIGGGIAGVGDAGDAIAVPLDHAGCRFGRAGPENVAANRAHQRVSVGPLP